MNLRNVIGSIATAIMITDFFKIEQLRFPYPYISEAKRNSQNLAKTQYQPGTWFLIIRDRFNLFSSFQQPNKDDLVLVQDFDGNLHFKIVHASCRTYSQFQNGTSYYVPSGFAFLMDPQTKTAGIEPIGSIKFFKFFPLGKWSNIQQQKKVQMKRDIQKIEQEKSLQQQILQKNNFLQQVNQIKRRKNQKNSSSNTQPTQYHDFQEDHGSQK